ncbi:UPF0052-domain-containing protein [Violaceomyces palustris]|uniref:UPF0052-domain-containing protein n=1 Tax=Violaceomyces palustris TaxID=1673888 RepID=A0ACD0P285_9BASI|nr:UPF0052-domain-containing protein [Violaceomyces palustris]
MEPQRPHHPLQEPPGPSKPTPLGRTVVISGGSGFNDLVGATPGATFVMPISDNGGSSSEIIRVLGGPSIGDLRSRLTRLIPISTRQNPNLGSYVAPASNDALHDLLSYRLPSVGRSRDIKQEWMDILEGKHRLWRGIEPERKECVRGFLVHFESEILRRAHRNFNFRGGSIGNFFLASAQKFFRSIQSAIFLFSATTQITASGEGGSKVLPVINTNHTATIAAELEDGEIIVGQCEISHPAPATRPTNVTTTTIAKRLESSGLISTQAPGTPSSAVFEHPHYFASSSHSGALSSSGGETGRRMEAITISISGPPGSGLGTSYDENKELQVGKSEEDLINRLSQSLERREEGSGGGGGGGGRSWKEGKIRGRQKVGNFGDGLDPDDDEEEEEDGREEGFESEAAARRGEQGWHGDEEMDEDVDERLGNIVFTKEVGIVEEPLPCRIKRIFYVNAYRNEVYPAPNPSYLETLKTSETLVYSCGSLWTSILPCLCLRGVATWIARSRTLRSKILLLNTVQDRETFGMDAKDFVKAIVDSLNDSDVPGQRATYTPRSLVTHVVYFPRGQIKVDVQEFESMGIQCIQAHQTETQAKSTTPKFDEGAVKKALEEITSRPS